MYPVKLQFEATVEAFQERLVLELVVPESASPVGVDGTVVHALHAPSEVQGCPLPVGPLLVAGLFPSVQKFAT